MPAERLRPPHDLGSVLALRRMRAPRPAPPPRQVRLTAGKVPGAYHVSASNGASQGPVAGRGARGRSGSEGAQVGRGGAKEITLEAVVSDPWAGLERNGPGEGVEYTRFTWMEQAKKVP